MLMLKLSLIPTTHMDSDTGDILALDILDLDTQDLDTLVLDTPGDSMERGLLMLMLKLSLIPTTHMDSDTGDILDSDTLDLDTPTLDTLALDILDLDTPDLDTLVLDTPGDSMERGLLMPMLKLKLIPTTHMDWDTVVLDTGDTLDLDTLDLDTLA